MFTLKLNQIEFQPGQRLIINDISWQDFTAILEELGEHRGARVSYFQGKLEIRQPLAIHEISKELIGDMIKLLMDELDMNYEPYGSSIFMYPDKLAGLEADASFYIQNAKKMIGKTDLNLLIDPPPDLVLEIDALSEVQLSAYLALGVPELWCYDEKDLQIFTLQSGNYVSVKNSPTFGNFTVIEEILKMMELSETEATSRIRKQFREWVRLQNVQHS